MISMPRCVTRASHVCITLFVRKIYRVLLKTFAKQFAIVAYVRSSNLTFTNPLLLDDFSRFHFPCSCVDAKTVISCLNGLFALFGMPAYIHSDRGTAFMSHALTSYLHRHGVACSKTSVYNAHGNGQCEQYNGIIWSAVRLALTSRKLAVTQWVLLDALHSIRSLLCTATNSTPHERLFNYKPQSSFGVAVPTWLSSPGPVFLRRYARKVSILKLKEISMMLN